jgi:hypothetical protein
MIERRIGSDRARREVRHAARQASPAIESLGRMGYAAKGVVYGLVGVLAAQAAAGHGGDVTDTRGALTHIVDAPFGRFLLAIVALGLVGYALWRFVQAALDTEQKGDGVQALGTRAGYALSGAIHVGLAMSAIGLVLGSGEVADGDGAARDHTAWLMDHPFGPWLVGAIGLGIVGAGLFQLYRAYKNDVCERLRTAEMSAGQQAWIQRLGAIGSAARGVVLGIIGGFLVVAARQAEPDAARGLGGALATVADQPAGPWLLGLVAAGLVAYGAFMLAQARYRAIVVN